MTRFLLFGIQLKGTRDLYGVPHNDPSFVLEAMRWAFWSELPPLTAAMRVPDGSNQQAATCFLEGQAFTPCFSSSSSVAIESYSSARRQ